MAIAGGGNNLWGAFNWGAATWSGFGNISAGAQINALLVQGNIIYGMVAITSGPNNGKDQPFAYNWATGTWLTIAIPGGAASLPTTPATTGDWTPPCMQQVAQRIIVTHSGFTGGASPAFGWLDISGFSDNTHTGDTHSTTTVNNLSANVLTAGWQVGMTITGSGIPANTTITAIAVGGLSITISNAATATASGVTFTVAGGTAAAPLWSSGNTNLNKLAGVPVAVAEFNGRAYYAVSNTVAYSDSGNACQMTTATQVLTFQNGLNVTALGGLPYQQTTGGLLQALMAFQGDATIQQITGDATTTLSVNSMGIGVGTLAPNSVCNTPLGLTFVAPDGIRYINFFGIISDVVGGTGDGIVNPFLNAQYPTRICAAYNQDIYRVTVQNTAISGSPYQEWWYHLSKKVWSGPHTSTCAVIATRQGNGSDNDFIIVPTANTTLLAESDVVPSTASSYTENGTALSWTFQPTLLPDTNSMSENCVVETTITLSMPAQQQVNVVAVNEIGQTLNNVTISGPVASVAQWGTAIWGAFTWAAEVNALRQYDVPWTQPLVFKQMTPIFTGFSSANFVIGNMYMKVRELGYRLQAMAATSGGAI